MGKNSRNNVAGASNGRHWVNEDVAGVKDFRDNVAGAFDENFKVKVHAYIDGEDFCRAVRRCLIHDLIAGAQDDNDRDDKY